ncbi:MAG TPA: acyl-CoA dehydrogenase family protein [Acidimicrobiia bacterium]|nr:acyl-CoA dehydrogenase family protein [Acidimicrobiia bacterium]
MDLDFTPEQDMLREAVAGVCARYAGLEVVRAMENDPIGYPDKLWEQLAELGLLGMTVPEEYGGSGMTMVDAMIVYTEFGRALAPSPHFVSSVMAAGVLQRAGSDEQRDHWLPAISAGEVVVATAWLEPGRGFGPEGVRLRADAAGDGGWRLTGSKRHVPFAPAADRLLVMGRADDGPTYFLVDPSAAGVSLTQQLTIASDTQYRVDFEGVHVGRDAVIGTPGYAWPVWHETMLEGIVLLAAQAVGGAQYAHAIATQYAKDRHQFDKPLGAFQSLAHYLSDGITAVDGAETLVWEAAWAHTVGRSIAKLAPMAKLFACQTFRDVTATAQQIFGGVGFTLEYDIQLYFRRAKELQISWWNDRYLEELVAHEVLDARVG